MDTATLAVGRRRRLLPYAALLVVMVSVQFGAALSKQLFPVLGVERTTFLRQAFGAVLLALVLKPWRLKVRGRGWLLLLAYSITLGGMNLSFYLALARIPLGITVALEFVGPLALAVALSHRRIDLLWVALAALGLLLLLPLQSPGQNLDPVGVAFALTAAACWAAYSVIARRIGRQAGTALIGLAMPIAALMILPLAAWQAGAVPAVTPRLLIATLAMALFSSALPYPLEMIALSGMPIRVYGTLTSLEPALGTIMGLAVLGELPSMRQLAGIAAIIVASLGAAALNA